MQHKKLIFTLLLSSNIAFAFNLGDISKMATDTLKSSDTPTKSTTSTQGEDRVTQGLKEALSQGVNSAITILGKENGFLNNVDVKIPLPQSLQTAQTVIKKAGYGNYGDDLINAMNSAASSAVPSTATVFKDSLNKMSIDDANKILNGSNTAATDYFRTHTFEQLKALIAPMVKKSISNNQVATYYEAFNTAYKTYGKGLVENTAVMGYAKSFGVDKFIPGSSEESLDEYITTKTLEGLFTMIEKEEMAIRANPVNRTTDLLKSIFK